MVAKVASSPFLNLNNAGKYRIIKKSIKEKSKI